MRRQQPGIHGAAGAGRTNGTRAVGNAEWTGVPLSVLLERAGLTDEVCELVLEGADRGVPKEEAKAPGSDLLCPQYPRTKAMESNVLIAYQMNGRDLTPIMAIRCAPSCRGITAWRRSKWLTDIVAKTQPFQGYWQTSDYGYWDDSEGTPVRRPLAEMKLKSQIARPPRL